MHPDLQRIIETVQRTGSTHVSYETLINVFKDNYNPAKGETQKSEMERWLRWAQAVWKIRSQYDDDGTMSFEGINHRQPMKNMLINMVDLVKARKPHETVELHFGRNEIVFRCEPSAFRETYDIKDQNRDEAEEAACRRMIIEVFSIGAMARDFSTIAGLANPRAETDFQPL